MKIETKQKSNSYLSKRIKCLGIEDDQSITRRGTTFLNEIAQTYKGKRILVVSHGALIGNTIKGLIPSTNIVYFHNTSMTILNFNGSDWECELFNCAKHLTSEKNKKIHTLNP